MLQGNSVFTQCYSVFSKDEVGMDEALFSAFSHFNNTIRPNLGVWYEHT